MRGFITIVCLFTTTVWAADRNLSLREGEKQSFKLGGVAQIAIDDAAVVEGLAKADQLEIKAKRAGDARVLVLLKSDQWVTFKVRVIASSFPEGPVPEALPAQGEPVRLRVGEARVFDTPGIQKMPTPAAQNFEAKVNGKLLELRGLALGRSVLELSLAGGTRLQLPVVVDGERLEQQAKRSETSAGERLEIQVSGELLLKAPDVEAVQVDDDDVAEVRIVGDGRVVVRGLQEGQTMVNVRRGGRVYSHPVNVVGSASSDY